MKKSCFVVDAPYLPLYCLEQCPKVFSKSCQQYLSYVPMYVRNCGVTIVGGKEEEVRGEGTEETNASTLVRVTSRMTISPKIHCEQTQM